MEESESDAPDILACLPAHIRHDRPHITEIAAGLSGAGVYLVKTDSAAFVLKITADRDSSEAHRRRVRVQQAAGENGVGPRVVHIDEKRNAILTAFIEDRSFAMLYFNPATRDRALQQLAQTLRTVHAMDPRDAATSNKPAAILEVLRDELNAAGTTPPFVAQTIERVRALRPPSDGDALVLCHNDVNPSNIIFDGERIILLDWDTSGAGDPYYDLASASVFFRMDDATCMQLVAAYVDAHVDSVPEGFRYNQCLVAGLCGSMFIRLAAKVGYTASVDPDSIMALADLYAMMRAGTLDVKSAEGQFKFGLALLKEAERYAGLKRQT